MGSVQVNHSASSILPVQSLQSEDQMYAICVGGGVMGFAFGPTFARSMCLSLGTRVAELSVRDDMKKKENQTKDSLSMAAQVVPQPQVALLSSSVVKDVVFVTKRNAKTLKMQLEKINFLDKTCRMRTTDGSITQDDPMKEICVPITQ